MKIKFVSIAYVPTILVVFFILLILAAVGGDRVYSNFRNYFHQDFIMEGIVKIDADGLGGVGNEYYAPYYDHQGSLNDDLSRVLTNKSAFYEKYPQIDSVDELGSGGVITSNGKDISLVYNNYLPVFDDKITVYTYDGRGYKKTYFFYIPSKKQSKVQQSCSWNTEHTFICQIRLGEFVNDFDWYLYLVDTKNEAVSEIVNETWLKNPSFISMNLYDPYFIIDIPHGVGIELASTNDFEFQQKVIFPETGEIMNSNSESDCRFWGQKDIVCYSDSSGKNYIYNLDTKVWNYNKNLDFLHLRYGWFTSQSPYMISHECKYGWKYFMDMSGHYECERMVFYLEKNGGDKIKIMDIKRGKDEAFPKHPRTTEDGKYHIWIDISEEKYSIDGLKTHYVIDPEKMSLE